MSRPLVALLGATLAFTACFPSEDDPSLSVTRSACETYCFNIVDICTGSDKQYESSAFCIEHCADWSGWDAGLPGNRESNDLACRETYVDEAGAGINPSESCLRAGPTGGGACGTLCENYCDLMEANCAGHPTALPRNDCIQKCRSLPTGGGPLDTTGDTVQCRIYHLGLAAHDRPRSADTHCPHGSVASVPGFCAAR
jgi:hypothetical protein